ncbi:MAG: DUF4349 domain-containing protein, partial [Chloroflexota bacterium]
ANGGGAMRSSIKMVLVAGAAAVVAAAIACGGGDDDDSAGGSGGEAALSERAVAGASASKGGPADAFKPSAAPATTGGGGGEPFPAGDTVSLDRKMIFTANLSLSAEDVANSFSEVGRIARTAGGFIERSSLSNRSADDGIERQFATITIRVPGEAYQETLASLRTLPGAKLDKEDSGSNEVTETYTDLQSRLRNLERSEAQYLRLMEQAKTIQEILTVQERLDGVRGQIEQVQGRLKVLDDLTSLATISVALNPALPAKAKSNGDGPKSPGEAFSDAWAWSAEAGRYLVAAAAAVSVAAIWLAVPALLVVTGLRLAGRRRGAAAP